MVFGDPVALSILLRNLIDNAIRYTPAGGRVEVTIHPVKDVLELCVSDNGVGVAPEQRARIFDRFFRGAVSEAPGSGLGLSIVRRIAEQHGARVDVDDGINGRGTSFRVIFPPRDRSLSAASMSHPRRVGS
jgi:signal transduction histidine kinase